MDYYNFYEIISSGVETGCFIIELKSFNNEKTKRYYCLQKMNNEVQMFKIKSIGTLVEYLDKYKMDLLQIKSIAKKRMILELLEAYIKKDHKIKEMYKYNDYAKNLSNKFNIINAKPLIDNKVPNYLNLTKLDYDLLKNYRDLDKYILNIKGNNNEKRK